MLTSRISLHFNAKFKFEKFINNFYNKFKVFMVIINANFFSHKCIVNCIISVKVKAIDNASALRECLGE